MKKILPFLLLPLCAHAASTYWSGRHGPDWSTPYNWNSHIPTDISNPANILNFDQYSTSILSPNLDAPVIASGLRFHGTGFHLGSSSGQALTLTGNNITSATNSMIINIDGNNTVSHPIFFSGHDVGHLVNIDSGSLIFDESSAFDISNLTHTPGTDKDKIHSPTITVNNGASLVTNGPIIAKGSLPQYVVVRVTKSGGGTWEINSSNPNGNLTLVSDIRIQDGDISFKNTGAFGTKTISTSGSGNRAIYINTPDGILSSRFNLLAGGESSTFTFGTTAPDISVTFSGSLGLAYAGTNEGYHATRFYAPANSTVTVNGVVSDSNNTMANRQGSVKKTGEGIVRFTAVNTYTEGTEVAEGSLLIFSQNGTGRGDVHIGSGGIFGGNGNLNGTNSTVFTESTASVIAPGDPDNSTITGVNRLTLANLDVTRGITVRLNPSTLYQIHVYGNLITTPSSELIFDFSNANGHIQNPGTENMLLHCPNIPSTPISPGQCRAVNLPDGYSASFQVVASSAQSRYRIYATITRDSSE